MAKIDIASTMDSIMSSPQYQAIFKTAAKKCDPCDEKKDKKDKKADKKEDKEKAAEKAKADKAKADKAKAAEKAKKDKSDADVKKAKDDKAKADKAKAAEKAKTEKAKAEKGKAEKAKAEKGKVKKKAMTKYQACVIGLSKISEALDEAGLAKASTHALLALDSLVKNAMPTGGQQDNGWAKDKKEEEDEEEEDEEEEEEEDEEEEDEEEEDEDEEKDSKKAKKGLPPWLKDKADVNDANTGLHPQDPGIHIPTEWLQNTTEGDPLNPWLGNPPPSDVIQQIIAQRKASGADSQSADLGDVKLPPEAIESLMKIQDRPKRDSLVGRTIELNPIGRDLPEDFSFIEEGEGDDFFEFKSLLERTNVAKKRITSLQKLAAELKGAKKDTKAKVRNRAGAIFESTHSKVKDNEDHFPIDTIGRARNALARVNQFSSSPSWWSGSLKELQNAVVRAVKAKYPSIEVSDKAKKPGKGK